VSEHEDVESLARVLFESGEAAQQGVVTWDTTTERIMHVFRDRATAALSWFRALAETGGVSDGHHTHRELYDYRMLYNAHAAQGWLAMGIPVVKSRHHSDGEPCFGGGWFIVVAMLPSGQVSNHYRDEHWDLFDVPEVDLPPEYDGHTPAIAAERLRTIPRARQTVETAEVVERGRAHVASLVRFAATAPSQDAQYDATMTARLIEHIIGISVEDGPCGACGDRPDERGEGEHQHRWVTTTTLASTTIESLCTECGAIKTETREDQ